MNYSKHAVCNLALSHFGATRIDSFENDQSEAGQACRAFFDVTFESFVREFDWPWARRRATLALVQAKPNALWGYAHRLFADCLAPRAIFSGQRRDDEDSEIPFEIGVDNAGGLVFSDVPEPELLYTFLPQDTTRIPSDAILALSYKLGRVISVRLVREDPFEIGGRLEREYTLAVDQAKVTALKDEKQGKPPAPSWIRKRR